jgi:hypothetical protein
MPNISMPDLIALKATVGSDENLWGNKLNEITDSIQATLESIITDLNFVTGLNSTWKVEAYATYGNFPLVGEPLVIYYDIATQLSYQWDGFYIVVGTGSSGGVQSVNGKTGNVTITKSDVGLGSVENLTPAQMPISTATQTALNTKANLNSPVFTGTVTLPSTTSIGTVDSTEISYLDGVTSGIQGQLNNKQPLDSDLTAIANLTTNGIVVRTSEGNVNTRSVAVSGTGLSVSNGDGVSGNPTITSNATATNTASTIVARDSSGNFNAGTISATLNGKANTADTLHTARTIGAMTGDVTSNGSSFNGGANNTNSTTIANNVVSNVKLADMPTKTIKGNDTLITDDPKDLTVVEVQNMITDTTHRFVTDSQISQWNSTSALVKSYETVALMQADQANLPNGSVVETLGYTTVNDGLGRKYIITATDVNGLGITVGTRFASKFTDMLDSKQTCKAWVNFNGTGTVTIRSSYNVSSITDLGTGYYRINFINPMSSSDYSAILLARQVVDVNENAYTGRIYRLYTPNVNNIEVTFGYFIAPSTNTYADAETYNLAIFGN